MSAEPPLATWMSKLASVPAVQVPDEESATERSVRETFWTSESSLSAATRSPGTSSVAVVVTVFAASLVTVKFTGKTGALWPAGMVGTRVQVTVCPLTEQGQWALPETSGTRPSGSSTCTSVPVPIAEPPSLWTRTR